MDNVYYVSGIPFGDELYHHGIKGQKWGVRRYQNEDGSLTAEGQKKYGTVENFNKVQKDKQHNRKALGKAVGKTALRQAVIHTGASAALAALGVIGMKKFGGSVYNNPRSGIAVGAGMAAVSALGIGLTVKNVKTGVKDYKTHKKS